MTQQIATHRTQAGRDIFKSASKKSKAKETKKDAALTIRVGEYGRYQIKSGRLAGTYIARAFPKPPTQARGLIAEATGETEEAAITALHAAIEARDARRTEDRKTDPHTGTLVPSTDEYVEALHSANLTRPQRAMLMALSLAETDGLTELKVAEAGSYKSRTSANRALASAGRMIAGYLSQDEAAAPSTGSDGGTLIGYRGDPDQDQKPGNWIMHPELCDAMRIVT
ncbi:hypothetical protein [Cognatishimia sp. F0-27]|uniref:hypothetical protein n=1 Tax=Cognatishimia sp. F0-27 TaxID=2816855 RepID=UPI001D0C83A9|nr:hypothetical protein [Cognatishimia sp. F0-27]MCC1491468.1 hypothetical protein [Cognatishimia sp. F0-27]